MNAKKKTDKELSFEESVERLDEILEQMNSGEASLDESLALFEEANKLISKCGTRLENAEQKIEKLVKNRQSELEVDKDGNPETEPL